MNAIKVSVVIPVYNVENYLRDAINSIITQTFKELEIIIINDGSNDSSLSIITDLANNDNRIRVINTPNNGLSVARNLGLYHALGEYIYFFDSDDLLDCTAIEKCYTKCKMLNLDFCFFDADTFSDNDTICKKFNYIRCNKFSEEVYKGIDILQQQMQSDAYRSSPCLNFINLNFLKKENLFFYPHTIHEDELFTFFLYLKADKVGFINNQLFHRRIRSNSIMTKPFSIKNAEGILTVSRNILEYSKMYGVDSSSKKLCHIKINELLSSLLNSIDSSNIHQLDVKYYRKTVLHEFSSIISFKLYLRLRNNSLYKQLLRIKSLIN